MVDRNRCAHEQSRWAAQYAHMLGFTSMNEPTLSLIIPAFNEEALLPRLLDTVDAARERYSGGTDGVEVVVADNNSTDDTAAVAVSRGCTVVRVEKRSIAAARNGGAAVARGSLLCWVDADNQIHPATFNAIDRIMADPAVVAGASGACMERWSLGIAATYYCLLRPIRYLTGMDTGVVFCRRCDFDEVGGYDESAYWAEDVLFLWSLNRLGRTRGQRLARLKGAEAVFSTRKFDRHGDWHYFTAILPLLLRSVLRPSAIDGFVRRYWYEERQ